LAVVRCASPRLRLWFATRCFSTTSPTTSAQIGGVKPRASKPRALYPCVDNYAHGILRSATGRRHFPDVHPKPLATTCRVGDSSSKGRSFADHACRAVACSAAFTTAAFSTVACFAVASCATRFCCACHAPCTHLAHARLRCSVNLAALARVGDELNQPFVPDFTISAHAFNSLPSY
jgi:hypothetical protein